MAVNIKEAACTGCGACVDMCPVNAIKMENGKAKVSDDCIECGACLNVCPSEAISLKERKV